MASKLTAKLISGLDRPGKYGDGDGLLLRIDQDGTTLRRRWIYRYTSNGRRREMGLGGFPEVNLTKARELRDKAKSELRNKIDPIANRKRSNGIPTFGAFSDEVRASLEKGFRNEKHKAQWKNTLRTYCAKIWTRPVDTIDTYDVMTILEPIWQTKAETASRLRARIEIVLDAAKAKNHRTGENPARWRGHLQHLLSKHSKLTRGHHKSMPISEVPAFIGRLRAQDGTGARALELCVLTALRTNSLIGGRWDEIDMDAQVWRVPGERMKSGKAYDVPLSPQSMRIVENMGRVKLGAYIFPGAISNRPISNMAMAMVLRRMGITNATVHGFRSSFRDWAGDETDHEREVAEGSLSHVVGDQSEQAYRRQNALRKRRKLMEDWAKYCDSAEKNETPASISHELVTARSPKIARASNSP